MECDHCGEDDCQAPIYLIGPKGPSYCEECYNELYVQESVDNSQVFLYECGMGEYADMDSGDFYDMIS